MALDSTQGDADRARLHLSASEVADDAGHAAEAQAHGEAALDLFDRVHDPIGAARAAAALSWAIWGNHAAASVAIAEPRWQALEGIAGGERARFELARSLASAHSRLGNLEMQIQYAGQMVSLAEALDDPVALATALGSLGTAYVAAGANRAGVILVEASAALARERDLPFPLARATNNLSAFQNSRDLTAALRYADQSYEVARRAGLQIYVEGATINKAVGLWCSGRFPEVAQLLPEGLQGHDIQTRIAWRTFEVWLAEAQGEPLPHRPEGSDADTDSELNLAWLRSADLARAVAASDHDEVTRLAPLVVEHALAAAGLDDDFFLLWPQSVLAALAVDALDLAERLLTPVTDALPGKRPPVVAAQWHRLRGLLAAARGDHPELAETEMRAGIDALAAFGAAGFHAQAQEELGRWLDTQGRAEEAVPLLDAARTTYADIGATGWLAGLETWDSSRQQAATSTATPF